MPSENTWDSQSGNIGFEWSGRIRSWNLTPNFGTIPKELLPVNGYSDRRNSAYANGTGEILWVWNYTYGYWEVGQTWDYVWTLGRVYSFYNWHKTSADAMWTSAKSGIDNATKVKALVKIADAKVNLAVAYAEAGKTSSLIYDTARRIDRAYRAFRRGDIKRIASELNITPGKLHKSWLEYKYGWMPLLMDVKGAAEFFAQQHVERKPLFSVTAVEKVAKTYDLSEPITPWGGLPTVDYATVYSREFTYKVKVWCELTSPHYSALQQLGLTNPALVAWELVPFSFVFDWFIQVGDWLTGITALQGVTVKRAFYSSIETEDWYSMVPASVRQDVSYKYQSSGQSYGLKSRHYERSTVSLDPTQIYPPRTNSFGFAKLVTSLALIRGGYRGSARL